MSRRQRFLSAIAHPQIAYLLLTLGILGLTVEFWNPGAIVPGVAGGVCLLLAFFAMQVLPVNTTGVLLVVFGLALLLLELKVPSFGALGHRRYRESHHRIGDDDQDGAGRQSSPCD